jgi:hypothetical protein
MASEAQYEFFKFRYGEGQERYKELIARGQIFLSIATLYIGVLSFKPSEPLGRIQPLTFRSDDLLLKWSYGLILIFLLVSLLLVILALGIYKYQSISDPVSIIKRFGAVPPTDDDFRDERIVDYAVATQRNVQQNNKRAKLLYAATVFLFLGASEHVLFFVLSNFR